MGQHLPLQGLSRASCLRNRCIRTGDKECNLRPRDGSSGAPEAFFSEGVRSDTVGRPGFPPTIVSFIYFPTIVSFIYPVIYLFIHFYIEQETLQHSPQDNKIKGKPSYSNQEEASRQQESRAYKEARGKNGIMVLESQDFHTVEP